MSDLKIGDVVYLKSGGPAMTVSEQISKRDYKCVWFADQKINETTLTVEALTKENPTPKPKPLTR